MPFIPQTERADPDLNTPGGKCFREYRYIMEEWAKSPRWGTIDRLAERLYPDAYERAFFLAFLVFFDKLAIPYEQQKIQENGDIYGEHL